MTNVPGTYPERPIICSPGRSATGSRRRPVDVPIQNFCIFVFPVKNSNRWVKQELLHLKRTFFIKLSFFFLCCSPKSPLKVPWRSRTLGPLGDLQGTSPECRVPAGLYIIRLFKTMKYSWKFVTMMVVEVSRCPIKLLMFKIQIAQIIPLSSASLKPKIIAAT